MFSKHWRKEERKMSSPVYIQIHNQLRQNIEDGEWKVGDKILCGKQFKH